MHKNFSSDRKVLEDAIQEMTKINPPEGQLWVDSCRWRPAAIGQKEPIKCTQPGSSSDIGRAISLALAAEGRGRFAMTVTPGCKTWSLRRRNRSPHKCIDNKARWQCQLRSCGRGFDSRCPSFCNQAVGHFGRLGIMANNDGVFTGLKTIREGTRQESNHSILAQRKR